MAEAAVGLQEHPSNQTIARRWKRRVEGGGNKNSKATEGEKER